jgi:hypothetical protein
MFILWKKVFFPQCMIQTRKASSLMSDNNYLQNQISIKKQGLRKLHLTKCRTMISEPMVTARCSGVL